METSEIVDRIARTAARGRRKLIALVGPPASGKSTLADALSNTHESWRAVPMDGFHLDNALLIPRDLLARKGSPPTFDAAGFLHLVRRLATEDDVLYPLFDRALDKSINAAGRVGPETDTVIVEGNYLLLDQPVWRDLAQHWDLSIRLDVPQNVLRERLLQRWLQHGLSGDAALQKAEANDLPNARLIARQSLPADITLQSY